MQESTQQNANNTPSLQRPIVSKKQWHSAVEKAFIKAKTSGDYISVIFMDVGSIKQVVGVLQKTSYFNPAEDLGELVALVLNNLRTRPQPNRDIDLIALPDFTNGRFGEHVSRSVTNDVPQAGHVGIDEFAILAHTNEEGVRIIIYRLLEAFEEYIRHPIRQPFFDMGADFIVGAATITSYMNSGSDLLLAADQSMYNERLLQWDDLQKAKKAMEYVGRVALKSNAFEIVKVSISC